MSQPRTGLRPKRWEQPWDPEISEADLDRIMDLRIVRNIDASRFQPPITVREIFRHDSRLRRFRRGDIIVRFGEYGHSSFLIMRGMVRVIIGDRDRIKPSAAPRQPWRKLFTRRNRVVEQRDPRTYGRLPESSIKLDEEGDVALTFLNNPGQVLSEHQTHVRSEGDLIGEMAALTRAPRAATLVAESDAILLELRWQGLRELRNRDHGVREYIDTLYRERALRTQLAETPLLARLGQRELDLVASRALVESYGAFEWFADYKRRARTSEVGVSPVADEPVIAEEGHHVDGLLIIRDGFARVTERLGGAQRTVDYVGKGEVFALDEIRANFQHGAPLEYRRGLTAVGYVTGVWIPTVLVQKYVLELSPASPGRSPRARRARRSGVRAPAGQATAGREATQQSVDDLTGRGHLAFFVDNRVINGTSTMLIDTQRCVNCDECVQACAATHDGNPRFVRHGIEQDGVMVANACMHCVDAVCLIGCPTGAIHRNQEDGRVLIDDATCIGCSTCANSCPYDNIRMVEVRAASGRFIVDEASGQPVVKATKCDLCFGSGGGPACERACPHDALVRVDMHDRNFLRRWLER